MRKVKGKLTKEEKAVLDKVMSRLLYEVGFTGCGPTGLDTFTEFPILAQQELAIWERIEPEIRKAQASYAQIKWNAWRMTMLEVEGVDLLEWDPTWISPEAIAEKEKALFPGGVSNLEERG